MDRDTLAWYASRADQYTNQTASYRPFPGLESEIERFGSKIPRHGLVADLGAGSGRDTRKFLSMGLLVIAVDACEPLIATISSVPTENCFPIVSTFGRVGIRDGCVDGAWVCASLLHLPRPEILPAVVDIARIIRPGGLISVSMKEGVGSRRKDGRLFTLTSKHEMCFWLTEAGLQIEEVTGPTRADWITATASKPTLSTPPD